MDFKSKFKKIKFKKKSQKKPRDGGAWKISAPGKKAVLSAGAVLMAGGLLAAGVLNMNTCAYTSSFLSDNSNSRKITDENYDYKKVDKHLIVRSAENLKESDGYKKIADGLYLVDKDKELDGDITVYEDGDVVIADADGADGNEDMSADTEEESNVAKDVQKKTEDGTVSDDEAEVLTNDEGETEANESAEESVEDTEPNEKRILVTDNGEADNIELNNKNGVTNNKLSEEEIKREKEELAKHNLSSYLSTKTVTQRIKVAVLDTGVSIKSDRILKGRNFAATGTGTEDDNGHGSKISKLILDNTYESNVSIVPVKVMDSTGHGTLLSLYQGIEYAIEQKVDVINISLATMAKDTTLIQNAISDAENAGIKVVAAAGNNNINVKYCAPANIDSVITVAAVDSNFDRATYSNYGKIDYAALGEYDGNKGTSFSAAVVTSAIADILACDRSLDVDNILNEYAYNNKVDNKYDGNGIIALYSQTRSEYYASISRTQKEINDKFDNWQAMSKDEFDKALFDNTNFDNALFWNDLSTSDKAIALSKSDYLNNVINVTHTEFESLQNSEYKTVYYKYLESAFNFDYTSAQLFTSNTGGYITFIFVGSDMQFKLNVTFVGDGSDKTAGYDSNITQIGTDGIIKDFKKEYCTVGNYTAPDDANFWSVRYKVTWDVKDGYTVSQKDYREDDCPLIFFGYELDSDHSDWSNEKPRHESRSFSVSAITYVVDVNPVKKNEATGEYEVINDGGGQDDLTFDVYNGKNKISDKGDKVKDYYEDKLPYKSHLYLENINPPTGYHCEGTNQLGYYDLGEITENSTFEYPKIALNHYNVVYSENVPVNRMTKKNECAGSVETQSNCAWDTEYTISACGYSLPGYEFVSWNTSADGTGTTYEPNDTFTKLSDTNDDTVYLYAQWKKLDYTVNFDLNGGKGTTPESITKAYGDNVSMPSDTSFKKGDKVFVGWSTEKDNIKKCIQSIYSGFSYKKADESGEIYMNSPGNMTLYALYTIPVSDVASVQLRVWQKDDTSKLYTSGPINFGNAKNGYRELSFDNKGIRKLVNLMKIAGGKYTASPDGKTCNLSADIVAKDNAGNEGIIWKFNVSGKETPPPLEQYSIKTEHQYKDINSNDGKGNYKYNIDCVTDAQTVFKNTKYTPKYLPSDSGAAHKIKPGYTPEKMGAVINGQSSTIMNGTTNVAGKVPVTITNNAKFIARYTPKQYKIHFKMADGETFIKNANADNAKSRAHLYINNKMQTMDIYYTEKISELPSASKTGYTFTGWKILKEDNKTSSGISLNVGDKYEYARDITVIPSWKINSYTIKYDATTNGGALTATSTDSDTVEYGKTVTVNKTIHNAERVINKGGANERKYVFVGWNTDPGAKSVKGGVFEDGANVLDSGKMPAKDITVYAIYKRTVTAKFYGAYSTDKNKPDALAKYGKCVSTQSVTYYNNDTFGTVTAPDPTSAQENLNWTFRGWSLGNTYDSSIVAARGSNINIDVDTNFYGLYQKNVTLTYISNCDAKIDPVNGTAYYNAAPKNAASTGKAKKNVTGTFDGSLKSNEANSYVGWVQVTPAPNCTKCQNPTKDSIIGTMDKTKNGCKCKCFYPNSGLKNKHQTGCTCCFMPGEAYSIDRDTVVVARWDAYPVISAKDTYISSKEKSNFEAKLLDSAESMDNEDVTTPISIQNKDEISEIINSTDENVDVTVIYKTIDSYGNVTTESKMLHVVNTASKDAANTSYARFINQKAKNASYNLGGLEKNSLWATKQSYTDALNKALANAESVKNVKANSSNAYTVNGKTYKPQYVLKYTNSDIKSVKQYLKNNGYGKFQKSTNMSSGSSALDNYYKTYVKGHKK